MFWKSSVAISTLLVLAQAAPHSSPKSPVLDAEIDGIVLGIKTYGDPANWPADQVQIVRDTMGMRDNGYYTTSGADLPTSVDPACTITTYNAATIKTALSTCASLVVKDLTVPANTTLDLSAAKTGASITFEGKTTWLYGNKNYDLLKLGGQGVTIQGAPGSVIDGNGAAWWDGIGSNGGRAKPNHMITGSKLTGDSVIKNLYIKNAPTHVFYISGAFGLTMKGILIDMKDGYALVPGTTLEQAHNTDGFDISSSTLVTMTNNVVFNQDDPIAVSSGGDVVWDNSYVYGGHGLSIGSVGLKSNNTVDGVIFSNSQVVASQNGHRIKTNSGATGSVNNVTYSNIQLQDISIYGIDIQQDYLNGGPTGLPTEGVNITNIFMHNIHGNVLPTAKNYYILVGPSADPSTWKFTGVNIKGGNSSCNVAPQGFNCK
ncbi:hypothetical protein QFC21_004923 [Naganishia friedmannii]|uniref:Uncharacterized protein n=1 Tax=Naganishia friedmannii TaxID=89922 RepID=A0ACC2VCY4_9TREE|nr:hypothetical protein QFC21_004923 [Naganishia friedmannii]